MKTTLDKAPMALLLIVALVPVVATAQSRDVTAQEALDQRVRDFLANARWSRGDMNVPEVDGQKLHDLIVENGYTRAVEVGTSTGHSTVWIAWALSKTGGKLLTIEIDERRYREALANLEEAGLTSYVEARLADAHELVPELEGPLDFAFVDADKDWYVQYFQWLLPEIEVGGCFTAHNVSESRRRTGRGIGATGAFVRELLATEGLETTFFTRGGGLSISYKRSPRPARG
jgi:predicted O-methyltransferase YrrM